MAEDQKSYVLVKPGTSHSPNILANVEDEKDILALCGCGCSKNPEHRCDGSHVKKTPAACHCCAE